MKENRTEHAKAIAFDASLKNITSRMSEYLDTDNENLIPGLAFAKLILQCQLNYSLMNNETKKDETDIAK